jgi:hypothetical protein
VGRRGEMNDLKIGISVISGIVIFVVLLLSALLIGGCATISLKPPTIQDSARTAGYLVALNSPDLVEELIKHTTVGQQDPLVLYPNWKRYLSYRLGEEGFLVVQALLTLVDVRLEFKTDEEKVAIIRELLRNFIVGLETGIQTNKTDNID